MLDSRLVAEFQPDLVFFRRRVAYLTKVVLGCETVIASGMTGRKLLCTRYTKGLPTLAREDILSFGQEMRTYRDAVALTLAAWNGFERPGRPGPI